MNPQSPSCSPFRESSGLLELVTDHRQVNSPSCTRRLMKDLLSHDPVFARGDFKENVENVPVIPQNKVSKPKKMESDDAKNVLGERNVNLGESRGPVNREEVAEVSSKDTVDQGSQEEEAEAKKVSPSPTTQRILELLDSIGGEDGDGGGVELPPYHPVHAPFSPRPRFMRLKRTPQKRLGNKEREERPTYDPLANPLSPRPEFLRYNPHRRQEFLDSVKRSLAFEGNEEEAQIPTATSTEGDNGMKKSSSCPELGEEVEDVPPLECNPREEAEVKTDEDKARAPKLVSPGTGGVRRWCGIFTRGLLLCLFIFAFVSGCVFLRGNVKQLQQKLMFRTWEWRAEHDDLDHEIAFPGTWDIIAAVSNESLMSIPESQEILVSVDDEDDTLIAGELAEPVKDTQETEEPVPVDDVEIAENTCSRESLDESILQRCTDRSLKPHDTSSPPVQREADDAVTETWTDMVPDDFFDIDDNKGIDAFVDDENWDRQMLRNVRSFLSQTFSVLQQRKKDALATLTSLVGVVSTLIYLMRKRRHAVAPVPAPPTPVPARPAASAPAAALTPSAPAPAPSSPATPHRDAYVISQSNYASLSTESETRSESNSNDEQYGSFTTLVEAHGRGGRTKVTPVRRSNRLRRSNQSPMLRA